MRFAILTEDLGLATRTRTKMSQRYGGARMTKGVAETEKWGVNTDWEVVSYGYEWQPPPGDLIDWGDSLEEVVAVVVQTEIIFKTNPNRKEAQ